MALRYSETVSVSRPRGPLTASVTTTAPTTVTTRNDWLCTSPVPGTRLSDLVLKPTDTLLCPLDTSDYQKARGYCRRVFHSPGFPGLSEPGWRARELWIAPCTTCRAEMLREPFRRSWKADHCQQCLKARKRDENRVSARRYRERNGLVKHPLLQKCGLCGESFFPQRSTATFCSGKCRVAAHRAKAKVGV